MIPVWARPPDRGLTAPRATPRHWARGVAGGAATSASGPMRPVRDAGGSTSRSVRHSTDWRVNGPSPDQCSRGRTHTAAQQPRRMWPHQDHQSHGGEHKPMQLREQDGLATGGDGRRQEPNVTHRGPDPEDAAAVVATRSPSRINFGNLTGQVTEIIKLGAAEVALIFRRGQPCPPS